MRAALESLLRSRKLDVTLTSCVPAEDGHASAPLDEARTATTGVPSLDAALGGGLRRGPAEHGRAPPPPEGARPATTGVPSLDAALGGGLRRGHLSEIVGTPSSGRTTLAVQTLAAATRRGEAVALVDTCDTFDPAS